MAKTKTKTKTKPNRKPNCKCCECKKEIYRRPNLIEKGNVFCSLKCSASFVRKNYIVKNSDLQKKIKKKVIKVNPLKLVLTHARGGVCEICKNNNFAILQSHHIVERSKGGGDDLENLMLLCPTCHALQHVNLNFPSSIQIGEDLEVMDD